MSVPHLKLSVNAADAISRTMYEQEETIRRLATENARLKQHIEMLDRANELMARERDKAEQKAALWQGASQALTRKLAAYHQERAVEVDETLQVSGSFSSERSEDTRDSFDGDSLADQIEAHRGRS